MRKGTNPNRNTTTEYSVIVNNEQSKSFGKLKEARKYLKDVTVSQGTEVKLVKNTTVTTQEIVDVFTAQSVTALVSTCSLLDEMEDEFDTNEE